MLFSFFCFFISNKILRRCPPAKTARKCFRIKRLQGNITTLDSRFTPGVVNALFFIGTNLGSRSFSNINTMNGNMFLYTRNVNVNFRFPYYEGEKIAIFHRGHAPRNNQLALKVASTETIRVPLRNKKKTRNLPTHEQARIRDFHSGDHGRP